MVSGSVLNYYTNYGRVVLSSDWRRWIQWLKRNVDGSCLESGQVSVELAPDMLLYLRRAWRGTCATAVEPISACRSCYGRTRTAAPL